MMGEERVEQPALAAVGHAGDHGSERPARFVAARSHQVTAASQGAKVGRDRMHA